MEENRATLTIGLWFLSAIVLVALFISATAQGVLTSWHVIFAFVLLTLTVAGTTFLWRGAGLETESQQAKAKRQRIDNLLRNMSDEEISELKQRLSDVDFSEEKLINYVGDDGELVQRN